MPFQTREENSLVFLTSDILCGVRHGFSTRRGGVSSPPWDTLNLGVSRGDNPSCVAENYRRFCSALGVSPERCVLSQQTHNDVVRQVTAADCGKGLTRERDYTGVDALICDEPDIPLVVFSADCNVILLWDPVRRAIGAAHAGWRGTALGIAAKTVRAMSETFGCDPNHIRAAVGPAIGQCCFETDDDVPGALRRALGDEAEPFMAWNGRKWHIDLKAINALWLHRAGVTQIEICDHCTACRQDLYWSHRKVGNARGSQVAAICL
jgi:hypothetical protein